MTSERYAIRMFLAGMICLAAGEMAAQDPAAAAAVAVTNNSPNVVEEPEGKEWSFSIAVYGYLVPDDREYVQPTVTADRGWLHLEARYNYEDLETGSAWVGYNFSGGEKLAWELTPMLGGVFGNTTGVAPGYRGSLSWWKLSLFTEGEYLVDAGDSLNNFFYSWSELSLAPVEWLRFGLAAQRTHVYESDREIQPGFLLGASYRKFEFTAYIFDPDESKPTFVLAGGVNF